MSGVDLTSRRGLVLLAATVLASSTAFLDATVVNVALPAMDEDLDAGTQGLTWVVTGYALPLASLILLGGALGDRHGRRRMFATGVVVFAVGSVGCAAAPGLEPMLASRGLQGVGAALLVPSSLALLQASVQEDQQGRAVGLWSGLTGVSAAIGPLLAGGLIEAWSWRAIFLINLPLAAIVLALVPLLPAGAGRSEDATDGGATAARFDVPGSALLAAGLAGLALGLTAWAEQPFLEPAVVVPLALGLAVLAGFGWWQAVAPAPLLPREAWSSRAFVWINVVTFLVYAVLSGAFLWVVVTLQVVAGRSPLVAGLALLPVTAMMMVLSSRAGVLADRFGPRPPMAVGIVLAAVALALLTRIGPSTDSTSGYVWDALVPAAVFGLGLAAIVTPLTSGALRSLPARLTGTASGVNNAAARIGGLVGVAVLPVVTGLGADGFSDPGALDRAFDVAMWVCVGVLVVAAVLTLRFVPGRDAESPGAGDGASAEDRPCGAAWHCAVSEPPRPTVGRR
ncbi:MAG TPA: MFS transporter [Nocardioides sp.]|nr:MFS transporter [Nocardioides sp.]